MWDNNFEIGEQVKVIDDNTVGVVIRTSGNHVWIATESGFDEQYLKHQLIRHESLHIPDEFFSNSISPTPIDSTRPIKPIETPVVDLHYGHLDAYDKNMPKNRILPMQLRVAERACEEALAEGHDKIILIHGKGTGKLEAALKAWLDERGWKHYDADFAKYKLGATEVELR
ncbi:MAG: hypothetical protein Q4F57_00330 [Weeksellaceae bacterium]|nr:hypothetical protein [Weeksellaceae bacterium]